MRKALLVVTGLSMIVATGTVGAAVIMSDDFESYTVGENLPASTPWSNVSSHGDTIRDWGSRFPYTGKFLELADYSSTANSIDVRTETYASIANAVTTFSFDFNEEDGSEFDPLNIGYSQNDTGLTSANSRNRFSLDDGTVGGVSGGVDNTYDIGHPYKLSMIFNNTGSQISYAGGDIAAGSAHIWLEDLIDGGTVFAGTSTAENAATTDYKLNFRAWTDDKQRVMVDNVELIEGAAAIPEPATLSMLGLVLFAFIYRKLRRK